MQFSKNLNSPVNLFQNIAHTIQGLIINFNVQQYLD